MGTDLKMKFRPRIFLFYFLAYCHGRSSTKSIPPFHEIATANVSMSLFVTYLDLRDGALTISYVQNLKWQDPRMMYPDIQGHKAVNNRTIITMDLGFLAELWTPDIAVINRKPPNTESMHKRLRIDSSGFIYFERLQSVSVPCKKIHLRRAHRNTSAQGTICSMQFELFTYEMDEVALEW